MDAVELESSDSQINQSILDPGPAGAAGSMGSGGGTLELRLSTRSHGCVCQGHVFGLGPQLDRSLREGRVPPLLLCRNRLCTGGSEPATFSSKAGGRSKPTLRRGTHGLGTFPELPSGQSWQPKSIQSPHQPPVPSLTT